MVTPATDPSSSPRPCRFLARRDPRCLPARLSALNAADAIYYCLHHPGRCAHRAAIAREMESGER